MSDEELRLVHLVDDDEAIRRSVGFMLKTSGFHVRSYESGVELLKSASNLEPGCILLDIRMPGMDGLELQRRLAERALPFPLIIITGHGDVPLAVRVMKAGALDFIEKPFAARVILDSTKNALGHVAKPQQLNALEAAARARLESLSSREREVLQGLLAGLPNKSIAYGLGISARTVEVHRGHVMQKMGARSLSELVRLGLAAGLEPSSPAAQLPKDLR